MMDNDSGLLLDLKSVTELTTASQRAAKEVNSLNDSLKATKAVAGNFESSIGSAFGGISGFADAAMIAITTFDSVTKAIDGVITKGFELGTGGMIVTAIGAVKDLCVAIQEYHQKPFEEAKVSMQTFGESMVAFSDGFGTAASQLGSYGSAFSEFNSQQSQHMSSLASLQAQMTELHQKGLADRNSITEEDLQNQINYNNELKTIHTEMLGREQTKTQIIATEATRQADMYTQNADAYALIAQGQISTLQEQVEQEKALLEEQYYQKATNWQMALEAGTITQAEYDALHRQEMVRQEEELAKTTEHLAGVNEVYANGYTERLLQDDDFKTQLDIFYDNMQSDRAKYEEDVALINSQSFQDEYDYETQMLGQQGTYQKNISKNWNTMTDNLNEEQLEQLANLVVFAAQTDMYGGELDEKTKGIVDGIVGCWEDMPADTKDVMANTIQPMLDEMKANEPELYAEALASGKGVISGFENGVDAHSPSRASRTVMNNVMVGAELGLEDKKGSLLGKASNIASSIIQTISKAFDVRSPSRVMRDIFEHVGEGMILGLEETEDDIYSVAERIGRGTIDILEDALDTDLTIGMPALATAGLNAQEALHGASRPLASL